MTIQEAVFDLYQDLRVTRRSKNISTIKTNLECNRIVVYTIHEEKQPCVFAYRGFPVSWEVAED